MAPAVFLLNVCKAKNIIEFSPYYFHIYGYDFHKYDILIVGNPQFHRFLIVMKFHGIPITKKQAENLSVLDEAKQTGEIEIIHKKKGLYLVNQNV